MKQLKTLKVGLRTLKTATAVFLCLALLPNEPFFACLTCVFCIQDTVENSIQMGKNRALGTIWGSSIGIIVMFSFKFLTTNIHNEFFKKLIIYILIALGIIVVIHCSHAFFNLPGAINISCIAFLAVTTAHAFTDPISYAVNRSVETLLGVVIGIIVNLTIHPPKVNKEETS